MVNYLNRRGLEVSRNVENILHIHGTELNTGVVRSRVRTAGLAIGVTGYHVGKIVARVGSLVGRSVGTVAGVTAVVATAGQWAGARDFAEQQGILLASTVYHIGVTPIQLTAHVAGGLLGVVKPRWGAKLMEQAVKIDRTFDTLDNVVQEERLFSTYLQIDRIDEKHKRRLAEKYVELRCAPDSYLPEGPWQRLRYSPSF